MNAKQLWTTWRSKRWVRLLMDGALVIVLVSAISVWQSRHLARGAAPHFEVSSLDGRRVSLTDLQGKGTLLLFWAPWCGVCGAEADNIDRVASLVGSRKNVVTIASDYKSVDEVRAWTQKHDVQALTLLGGNELTRRFHVNVFPSAFFLDGDGNITHALLGYTTTWGLLWRLFV